MHSPRQKNPEIIFSLFALIVIIAGYTFISSNDTSLHTAAVAKTGKAYSAEPAGKVYTAPANTTASTTNDSASSSTASYQQNGSNAYAQLQQQPLYASNVTDNHTATESSTASTSTPPEEQAAVETISSSSEIPVMEKPKAPPERSKPTLPETATLEPSLHLDVNLETTANKTSTITLDITNPTSRAVIIQPIIEEISTALPNEEKIRALLAEELLAEQSQKKAGFPQKDFPQKLQKNMEVLQLMEKEKVRPIYIRKVYHPFQSLTSAAITAVTYTGKRTSGELLQMPSFDSFIVPALEQKKVTLKIPSSLSAAGREVQFSILANGEKKYAANLKVPPSFAVDFDIDNVIRRMDVYLSVPTADNENKKHEYLVEIQIAGEKGTIYYELFGPYSVAGSESALFSQQFRYEPAIISGTKTVTLIAFKDGQSIHKAERTAEFG